MSKIFYILVFLSLTGAGALYWLMKTAPEAPHAEQKIVNSEAKTNHMEPQDVKVADIVDNTAGTAAEKIAENSPHNENTVKTTVETPPATAEKTPEVAVLALSSEPKEAHIYLNNEFKGNTPLEITLSEAPQNLRLESDGYEDYEKALPKLSELKDEKRLNWKIQLKAAKLSSVKVSNPLATKTVSLKATPKTAQKESYVQIKAFPEDAKPEDVAAYIKAQQDKVKMNIVTCKIKIGDKGMWTRVLVGPFKAKKEALLEMDKIKTATQEDAFITFKENCET